MTFNSVYANMYTLTKKQKMKYETQPKPAELPKLSNEVAETFSESMAQEDPSAIMHRYLEKIHRDNPVLYDALMHGAVHAQGHQAQESFRDGAVLMYALLSAQLETEQLNDQI